MLVPAERRQACSAPRSQTERLGVAFGQLKLDLFSGNPGRQRGTLRLHEREVNPYLPKPRDDADS